MPNAQGEPTPGDPDYIAPTSGTEEDSSGGGMITQSSPAAGEFGVSVSGYMPEMAAATLPGYQGYSPTEYALDPASSVQGKVRQIVDEDSPLMRQAALFAKQEMNARGLINSSIAIDAGHQAVIRQALPIAQQDSAQDFRAMERTADAKNAASAFEAAAANAASIEGARMQTSVSIANADAVNKSRAFLADASNRASLETALANLQAQTQRYLQELASRTQMEVAQLNSATTLQAAQIQSSTQLSVAEMNNATQLGVANINRDAQLAAANISSQTQMQVAGINQATQMQVANLQAGVQRELGLIDAQNRNLLQTNVNAANMFNQVVQNISTIQNNPNLDLNARNAAIQLQIDMLHQSLGATTQIAGSGPGAIGGLNLAQFYNLEIGSYLPEAQPIPVTQPAAYQSQPFENQGSVQYFTDPTASPPPGSTPIGPNLWATPYGVNYGQGNGGQWGYLSYSPGYAPQAYGSPDEARANSGSW